MDGKPLPKIALARKLRKAMTTPETLLWHRLKTRDETGFVFRRQHAFGAYILDFYCAKARLCVEVDGVLHSLGDAPRRDAVRDKWLEAQGILTYRLTAADVYKDVEACADGIKLLALERMKR